MAYQNYELGGAHNMHEWYNGSFYPKGRAPGSPYSLDGTKKAPAINSPAPSTVIPTMTADTSAVMANTSPIGVASSPYNLIVEKFLPTYQNSWSTSMGMPGGPSSAQANTGTASLYQQFEKTVGEKAGRKPTSTESEQFLGSALNPSYAISILQGQDPTSLAASAVKNYLLANPKALGIADGETAAKEEAARRYNNDLDKKLAEVFGQLRASGSANIAKRYGDQRRRLTETQAGWNRLGQPIASIPEAELGASEASAQSEAERSLTSQELSERMSNYRTLESLLAGQDQMAQQNDQFNQQLGLKREENANTAIENMIQRRLASDLGRISADAMLEAKKPGVLDYINTGVNILSPLTKLIPQTVNVKEAKPR